MGITAWASVAGSLRRYGGVDLDPGAEGQHRHEEANRVNHLDRAELDQVVQVALLDALSTCPRPSPRRFFPWLKTALAHRALDHVSRDLGQRSARMLYDNGIKDVVDAVLADDTRMRALRQWRGGRGL